MKSQALALVASGVQLCPSYPKREAIAYRCAAFGDGAEVLRARSKFFDSNSARSRPKCRFWISITTVQSPTREAD